MGTSSSRTGPRARPRDGRRKSRWLPIVPVGVLVLAAGLGLASVLLTGRGAVGGGATPAPVAPERLASVPPAAPPPLIKPAPRDPFLKAAGLDLRNARGSGDVVPLRGVNLGSWLVMEHWMSPLDRGGIKDHWTALQVLTERFGAAEARRLEGIFQDTWIQEQDFVRIAGLGLNVVRIPVWYRTFQEEDGTWRPDAFTRLDWAVATAWRHGIYTMIDLHGPSHQQRHDAHCTGRIVPKATLWSDPAGQQAMVDLWARVAAHYVGNPAVASYDLLNEPMDVPRKEDLWDLTDRCIAAIRAVDPDHVITVENTFHRWNLEILPDPKARGWKNVAYQYHVYPWPAWNDEAGTNRSTDGTIADWRQRAAWQVPVQVGEFNMGTAGGWNHAVTAYSQAGVSWMNWAWKTASNSTWGTYLPAGIKDRVPDLRNDSLERIAACWGAWSTDHYQPNAMVAGAIAQPVAVDEEYPVTPNTTLTIPAPGVLANDTKWTPDGKTPPLTAQVDLRTAHGIVEIAADGAVRYTPEPGFTGYDQVTYRVSDGRTASVRLATCWFRVAAAGQTR